MVSGSMSDDAFDQSDPRNRKDESRESGRSRRTECTKARAAPPSMPYHHEPCMVAPQAPCDDGGPKIPARRPDEHPGRGGLRARSRDARVGGRRVRTGAPERVAVSFAERSTRGAPYARSSRQRTRTTDTTDVQLRDELRPRRGDRSPQGHSPPVRAGEDRAARGRNRRDERVSTRSVGGTGCAGAARDHRRGGIRRRRHGLPRARRRDGGSEPGVGLGRALLRRPLQSLREPDPAKRQPRTTRALPPRPRLRPARRRTGDERVERRLRRGLDEAPRREAQRPLRDERYQDVDHQRSGRRRARDLRQDRSARRPARHHRVHRGTGIHGVLHRPEARQARHARLRHLRARVRRLRSPLRERARRGRPGRTGADVRPRLRTRGARGRTARHHGRVHGRGGALRTRAEAVRPADRRGSSSCRARSPTCTPP